LLYAVVAIGSDANVNRVNEPSRERVGTVSGRHRGRASGSLRTPLAIAAVVALIAIGAVSVRAVAADGRGCGSDVRLTVASAPDLEPVVRDLVTRWMQTSPKVNGVCVNAQVRSAEPADVANMLASQAGGTLNVAADPAPTPNEADIPAVWIPDSTAWILRVQAVNKDAFEPGRRSLAASPVVFGVPEGLPLADRPHIGAADIAELLAGLGTGKVKLGAVEPRRDTAGLAAATLLRDAIVTTPDRLVDLVKAYRATDVAGSTDQLLGSLAGTEIAPMSEQRLLTAGQAAALRAVPLDPPVALDYPYTKLTGRSPAVSQAADLLLAQLGDLGNRDAFARAGFRAPDGSAGLGFPAGRGVSPSQQAGQSVSDAAKIIEVLGYWTATTSPSRVLTLVDVTSSMNQPIVLSNGTTISRIDLLRKTGTDGLKLFTDDSQLGLWAFAAGPPGTVDYREVVPVGPLDTTQRTRLNTALSSAAVSPTNTCGLYQSVLAAYKTLRDGYRPGLSNTVVVFTDGTNSKPGMSLEAFETQLELATDPTRPVRVVLLGIGPDVNQAELADIAHRAGGRAFAVKDPDQIGTIFLEALLRPS
jgi:hypothetical protein